MREQRRKQTGEYQQEPLKDFEYLTHHVTTDDKGQENLWHCFLYDHIANMFEQRHIVIKSGKATMDGAQLEDGTYHIVVGLEPTQDVSWSDEDANKVGITPKAMMAGMKFTQKAKEW